MNLTLTYTLVVLLHFIGLQALIIPDELPSILSIIYSNIPTLKKGTDSRFGWGFRLGDRADFQVLTELGPQTYTQPLANQDEDRNSKREALNSMSNALYAKRLQEKREKERLQKENVTPKDTELSAWLQTWSKEVASGAKNEPLTVSPKPGLGIGEIDAKSVLPDDSELERIENLKKMKSKLKKLLEKVQYAENKQHKVEKIETNKEKNSKESPLDDVSLD